jgi:hypothetical protein
MPDVMPWRREWDGRRYHDRQGVAARFQINEPDAYNWAVEYDGHCIGGAGLRVNRDQHRAAFWIGLFVADLRGRGTGPADNAAHTGLGG